MAKFHIATVYGAAPENSAHIYRLFPGEYRARFFLDGAWVPGLDITTETAKEAFIEAEQVLAVEDDSDRQEEEAKEAAGALIAHLGASPCRLGKSSEGRV